MWFKQMQVSRRVATHVTCNMCMCNHSRATTVGGLVYVKGQERLFHHNTQLKKKTTGSSSNVWLERQRRDIFVKQAGNENYRCRSAFKLLQIQEKFDILQPGQIVIDCGAAPGSWCQVALNLVNSSGKETSQPQGRVVGLDIQHIAPLEGATLLSECDFTLPAQQKRVMDVLAGQKADAVLSDMAPSATGIKEHNHMVIIQMCFSVLRFSLHNLRQGGTVLCKLWEGNQRPKLENAMKSVFSSVRIVKPAASRDNSAEIFLLGRGFMPPKLSNKKS